LDNRERRWYCSDQCWRVSRFYRGQLSSEPFFLRDQKQQASIFCLPASSNRHQCLSDSLADLRRELPRLHSNVLQRDYIDDIVSGINQLSPWNNDITLSATTTLTIKERNPNVTQDLNIEHTAVEERLALTSHTVIQTSYDAPTPTIREEEDRMTPKVVLQKLSPFSKLWVIFNTLITANAKRYLQDCSYSESPYHENEMIDLESETIEDGDNYGGYIPVSSVVVDADLARRDLFCQKMAARYKGFECILNPVHVHTYHDESG
jgi:hypothetical protein